MKTSLFRLSLLLGLLLVAGLWLSQADPAAALAPQPQVAFQTPTPGPDGRILYTVKAGDTCISISLLTGISIDELRRLNNLKPECVIAVNTPLLLGIVEAAQTTATVGPSPTPTPLLPTPTPFNGTGDVCIFLYDDRNGDSQRQLAEPAISEGQVSLTDREGKVSKTGTTTLTIDPDTEDYAPICFTELEEGDYNVSVAIPAGYNPTTVLNYALELSAGDQLRLNFGAQQGSAAVAPAPQEGGRSPLMGILGGLILLCGVGLGVYIKFLRR